MPLRHRHLDFEFSPAVLIERIVRGAVERDMVRLHGAIVAALDLHGAEAAERDVFAKARAVAAGHRPDCAMIVSDAVTSHFQNTRLT